jgi:glycine betaine catabolism B
MSGTFSVRFLEGEEICSSTGSFRFVRPDGYRFAAGQFGAFTLQTAEGEQTKDFSHASAPGDPFLELTARLTGSAFKNALLALRPGDVVKLDGPKGRLTVAEGVTKAAFLVGGVGTTVARSIVRDGVQRSTGLTILVFDGNTDQSCMPFRDEFDGYAAGHDEIRVVDVLEKPLPGWTGETGFITADLVRRHCDPLDGWHWYVAGPPAMAAAMKRVVADLALPAECVSTELFTGYR